MEFQILYIINELHNIALDKLMVVMTTLGNGGMLWIAIAVILLLNQKTRKCGILMLVSMAIGYLVGNIIMKNLIQRARPCWLDNSITLLIQNPADYSFPSGHTLASFEAAFTIFLFNKKWGSLALIVAALIGFSRIYLFVHFPSDVLFGMILGIAIATASYFIQRTIENKSKLKNETPFAE